jgi:hypothetical protein
LIAPTQSVRAIRNEIFQIRKYVSVSTYRGLSHCVLLAANSDDQSSGGLPDLSIFRKTVYGSVLLPDACRASVSPKLQIFWP